MFLSQLEAWWSSIFLTEITYYSYIDDVVNEYDLYTLKCSKASNLGSILKCSVNNVWREEFFLLQRQTKYANVSLCPIAEVLFCFSFEDRLWHHQLKSLTYLNDKPKYII